jgi:PAS domain S-box-containing protein
MFDWSISADRPYSDERGLAAEMFRLTVEACPSGLLMIDHDGRIVMVNTEIEQQFGYAREELIGQSVDILVPERFRQLHHLHRQHFVSTAQHRRAGAGRELSARRKDGSEFPVEVGLTPIQAGERLLVLGVIVDISQRKDMVRLKDEFVSTVSHELRTPLTSISGSLGLLVAQWSESLPESATRLVSIAHKNIQRLVRLINDILDIEKLESGRVVFNLARVGLRQVVEQAIDDNRGFAEEFGVHVSLDSTPAKADVNADPDRLAQVLTNLLSNAIKFSSRGGEVLVAVEKLGETFRVSVRDHGAGIPPEFKSQIFEKFAQADGTNSRQKGGTGLGLSIVKQIVERLGGHVSFHDAPGGGTVFFVELPAWDESAGGEIDVNADASFPRLLLCDDDPSVAKVMRMRLRTAGFAVDFAHTPSTALVRAGASRYAAIIVDLRLRESDGIDLIVGLRAQPHHGETPIVVISGDPARGREDVRAPRLNILEWVSKPIDFARLSRILLTATSRTPSRRPLILHVDDDPDVLALVARELGAMADVISADGVESALRALSSNHVDLVVLDIALGDGSGLDLLPDLRDRAGNVLPVIVFSAHCDDAVCDDQINSVVSKLSSPLESLTRAVRDRLALLPALAA